MILVAAGEGTGPLRPRSPRPHRGYPGPRTPSTPEEAAQARGGHPGPRKPQAPGDHQGPRRPPSPTKATVRRTWARKRPWRSPHTANAKQHQTGIGGGGFRTVCDSATLEPPWCALVCLGVPWCAVVRLGAPRGPWRAVACRGVPWCAWACLGAPWWRGHCNKCPLTRTWARKRPWRSPPQAANAKQHQTGLNGEGF